MSWGIDDQIGWGNLEPSRLATLTDFDEIFSRYKTSIKKKFFPYFIWLVKPIGMRYCY